METQRIEGNYENDGVIRVRGLLGPDHVAEIRGELQRYIRDVGPSLTPKDITYEADGTTVRNLWRMDQHDEYFARLAKDPQLLAMVEELVHGTPVLLGVETFNKPARVGSKVPPHQDNAYFCQDPPDVLTVWVAIDAVTEANGPVFYIRGSQNELLPHKPSGVAGNSMGLDASFDDSDPFVGTLQPGDALIHHSQVIHYSAPNTTDRGRLALLMVFRGEHTRTDDALRASYARGGALSAS